MHSILFVDDESNILKTLSRQLHNEPYEKFFTTNTDEALAILKNNIINIVISDIRMPNIDGISLLSMIKKMYPETRRVVLTGYKEIDNAICAINEAQIHAYISKPWDINEIKKTIQNELTAYNKSNMQKEYLEKQATIDVLTGLDNRRSFNKRYKDEWLRAIREKSPLSVAIADIDFFKKINDNYGHIEGDRILSETAKCLKKTLQRPGDFIARYGGEEFILILPNTDNPLNICKKLHLAVINLKLPHPGPQKNVTISIGAATCKPQNSKESGEKLLDIADKELYKAKTNGRNRIFVSEIT
ncbi:MAG: GGDEF domain-containing response regulator [Planctomycetota bacterium]|jgi:diguanylate cyclase (GGDEF)-like protein